MLKYKIPNTGCSIVVVRRAGGAVVRVRFTASRQDMYNLKEFKAVFDPILKTYLDQRIEEFNLQTSDDFIKDFVLHSKKIVLNEGKRLRPYLAYLMYCSLNGKDI